MIQTYTPTLSPVIGWTDVSPSGGIKDSTYPQPREGHLCSFNSKLYFAWLGLDSSFPTIYRIFVTEYNPTNSTWTRIDPGSSTGINFSASTSSAHAPNLCVFNSKLYCTWVEENSGETKVRVKVWSGSGTSWSFVDGNAGIGLNKAATRNSNWSRLIVFNSKLYCTWTEGAVSGGNSDPQVRVRVYNGDDSSPSWTFVDGGGALGLNKSTTEPAYGVMPIVFDSKLYIFWTEANSSAVYQLRCRVYNGDDGSPSWAFVDGGGANGINGSTSEQAGKTSGEVYVSPYVFDSKLYVLWVEGGSTAAKPLMKVYNGDDGSPSWSRCDGGTSNGLIFDTSKYLYPIGAIAPPGWNPHFAWQERTPITGVTMVVYNGIDSGPRVKDVDTSDQILVGASCGYSVLEFLDTLYYAHQTTLSGSLAFYVFKATT